MNATSSREPPACTRCGEALSYSGHVDKTAMGHQNREQERGIFKCRNEACENFETVVEPS
ncbi:hypothetical protein [Streptomyces sp. NBC_00887]|uniref:hypothetical protein n=1 Tax=Streptomyces sp. NBC_00887 TaxID=2975859 RepID=UPI0038708C28|nr:hypothetical protein OG844_00275 [Streptomyces sp. NBC_00887]WSY36358.1 hypothetical protein OG844_45325 [Streptomyces sp. NBC_00887]